VEGSFEQSNERSPSIKCWEVHNWRLLEKGSDPSNLFIPRIRH
jgi:hypothetical protein